MAEQLGPNGLPLSRCPPVHTRWSKRSAVLKTLPDDPARTMHPHILARERAEVGGGMGLFVYAGIPKGEVVWAEPKNTGRISAAVRKREWIEALPPASRKAYCHFMYKTGEDEYQSLAEFDEEPVEEYPNVRTIDVSSYMNHSCSPTCWFVHGGDRYEGVMVAVRDLVPGDEITYDYCTSEDCDLTPAWDCHCGAGDCRGLVEFKDWQLPELQERYRGHFQPHIAAKIAQQQQKQQQQAREQQQQKQGQEGEEHEREQEEERCGSSSREPCGATLLAETATEEADEEGEPLEKIDLDKCWWLRVLNGGSPGTGPSQPDAALRLLEADRRAALAPAARGEELDRLNRQAAMLLAQHGIHVAICECGCVGGNNSCTCPEGVGRYLLTRSAVATGELVMLLPPNMLLWEEEVDDLNTCVQLLATSTGARLFSSSLSEADLDNFICHSCDPNCDVAIGAELAAGLVARRPIAAGERITFDYDTTEEDLRGDRGGFKCHCGAAVCRGEVLGRLFSPKPPLLAQACSVEQ